MEPKIQFTEVFPTFIVYVKDTQFRIEANSFKIEGEFCVFTKSGLPIALFRNPEFVEIVGNIEESFMDNDAKYDAAFSWQKLCLRAPHFANNPFDPFNPAQRS